MENKLLSRALKLFSALKIERLADIANDRVRFGKSEVAVLKVAMMVAALDGNVTADEFKAFERLAAYLPGGDDKADVAKALNECLRVAGYVELQAKRLKPVDLIRAFVDEAMAAIPKDFLQGKPEQMRCAFMIWVTMAMSDRDYSPVERKCIVSLRSVLDELVKRRNRAADREWRSVSPTFAIAYAKDAKASRLKGAPSLDFLESVENLVAAMRNEAKAKEASAALKALIRDKQ